MAEKLGESSWTGFTRKKGLKLDDVALVKALGKFDKTDEAKPGPRVDALEEVVEQIKRQVIALAKRKKELGDKPFAETKDKLDDLLGMAESELKRTRAAAAESEEEADSPVLLTTKMVPLVRELRKGEVRMPALISTAGKQTAVLIMRRSIAPTRRKLMSEFLDAQGGVKHITAECLFEEGALTFVVASPAAGLAKRVRAALLAQLELRLKVRVRGEDGAEDVDGEEGGDDQPGVQATRPQAPTGGPASAAALAYTQRLRKLRDRLEQALRDKHPESTKLRAVMGFASEKAASGDHAGATKALEMLEKLLGGSAGEAPGKPASAEQEYARRRPEIEERVQQALRAQHAQASKLRAVSGFAGDKAAKGDHAAALKALQMLEDLLGSPQAGAGHAEQPPVEDAEVMQARLQAVREDVARLGAAGELAGALRDAAAAVQANSGNAHALLDALEQRVAALAREQRAAAAAETVAASRTEGGVGVVEFAKMRLELEKAHARFDEAIDNLKGAFEALLESDDFVDDPRSTDPETLARIDTLEQRLPSFPELSARIDDAIDDMANATDPKLRKRYGDEALKAIAAFRAQIDKEPMLTEMESTDAGSFPIYSTMVAALERIESALRA